MDSTDLPSTPAAPAHATPTTGEPFGLVHWIVASGIVAGSVALALTLSPWGWAGLLFLGPVLVERWLRLEVFHRGPTWDPNDPGGSPGSPEWHAIAASVQRRDRYRCVDCSARDALAVVHERPLEQGGDHRPSNLLTLCQACRKRRADPGPSTFRAAGLHRFTQRV